MSTHKRAAASIDVVLLDDHTVVRDGVRTFLEQQSDIRVVGEAASVAELEKLKAKPDVVISDLVLPDGRGAEVISRVTKHFPRAAVLVLSMVDNPSDVHLSFAAGARGYLLKEAAATDVVEAVRKVAKGEDYILPALGAALAKWGGEKAPEFRVSAEDPLTDREREVLRLIALGHTNAEIAEILHVSLRTVESHRANIHQKLGLETRAELVRYAAETGLISES